MHKVLNEPVFSDINLAVVYNNIPQPSNAEKKEAGKKKTGWEECPYNQDQLDRLFKLSKVKKSIVRSSFMIDCGDQKMCEKVFSWVSVKTHARNKK